MRGQAFTIAALLAGVFLSFHVGDDVGRWVARLQPAPDDVEWLRLEFGAGRDQLGRLVSMQQEYRNRSATRVQEVEEASLRVASGLDRSGAFTSALRKDLAMLEAARARAHELALEHCMEVARVLGPAQGDRYLREMERVLIGLAPRHHSGVAHASAAVSSIRRQAHDKLSP